MNEQWALWGLQAWKPVLAALLLPPVPGLLAIGLGALVICRRRLVGWLAVLGGSASIWLGASAAPSAWLESNLLDVPAALTTPRIAELRARPAPPEAVAVLVLGGGRESFAPEYGSPSLEGPSLERLRYGIWLARATGRPLGFSGGVGWGDGADEATEAQVAAKLASHEFALPLRWIEDRSRDTRGNAERSVPLLLDAGVRHVLLVTHGWHMPRALRAFEAAAAGRLAIEAAPMGLAPVALGNPLDWLPSSKGATRNRQILREWIGLRAGA